MDWPNITIGDLGTGALVTLAVIALFRGWLVPRSTLDDVRADRDARLAEMAKEREAERAANNAGRQEILKERDDWRAAYFDSEKSRSVLVEQVGEFTELARQWLQAVQASDEQRRSVQNGEG